MRVRFYASTRSKEWTRKELRMGAAYAQDLLDRVLAAYDRGMKTKQIADLFQVSPAWARRVKQCRRETTHRPMGGAAAISENQVPFTFDLLRKLN